MPKIRVVLFQEAGGSAPVLDWLDALPPKAQDKCLVKIERLRDLGHELRRPEADLLRDGIYELRIGLQGLNFRILYFFHGRVAAVLAHGLVKEREVPTKDIEKALERKRLFQHDPYTHVQRGMNMAKRKRATTSDAVEILYRRYYEGRPERVMGLQEARANDSVARMLTALRLNAGLTQRQLAKRVGTTASAICRLEDAEYEGHSLAMLNRIASALKQRVEIRFVPDAHSKRLKTA